MTHFRAERLSPEPIIHARLPGLEGGRGANINGPSLIRVPSWIPRPLGRYYLYFAHHGGHYLRMAWADDLAGPWTVRPEPGVLHMDRGPGLHHIASPDVHVDTAERRLRMYFHQPTGRGEQRSHAALSEDGLSWQVNPADLGPSYFRVFPHGGRFYACAMSPGPGGGLFLRSRDGLSAFEEGPAILPGCRHAAAWVDGGTLHLFYSRKGDSPERILVSAVDLSRPWEKWQPGPGTAGAAAGAGLGGGGRAGRAVAPRRRGRPRAPVARPGDLRGGRPALPAVLGLRRARHRHRQAAP